MRKKITIGDRFGRLVVEALDHSDGKSRFWQCVCDCGGHVIVQTGTLNYGHTRSCGCLHRERAARLKFTHGAAGTREYNIWKGMRKRCNNLRARSYSLYGGRGIKVCDRWNSFSNFFTDMGECPEGLTLERIDNDGNYEPSNCKWASYARQGQNRTSTKLNHGIAATIRKEVDAGRTLTDLADQYGCTAGNIWHVVNGRTWIKE